MFIMKRLSVVAAVLLGFPSAVLAQDLPQRPMQEMHGDCSNFAWDLTEEFRLWDQAAVSLPMQDAGSGPGLESGRRFELALVPQPEVAFTVPPEQDRGGPDKFAGIIRLTLPTPGLYRISASNPAWIDLVRDGTIVPSAAFEMQTECRTIFKTVAYRVETAGEFLLQINGSPSPMIGLLITTLAVGN